MHLLTHAFSLFSKTETISKKREVEKLNEEEKRKKKASKKAEHLWSEPTAV